ncbi:unnamed protein product, partial [Trypanosoma congolense IL3000]
MHARDTSCCRKGTSKDRGSTIVIPNIPKTIDARARSKLLSDYERYEAELFKHHLGTAETTCTMGVRLAPADFDRRVPGFDEPTAAELNYNSRKKRVRERRYLSEKFGGVKVPAAGGNNSDGGFLDKRRSLSLQKCGSTPPADGGHIGGPLPSLGAITPGELAADRTVRLRSIQPVQQKDLGLSSPGSAQAPGEAVGVVRSPSPGACKTSMRRAQSIHAQQAELLAVTASEKREKTEETKYGVSVHEARRQTYKKKSRSPEPRSSRSLFNEQLLQPDMDLALSGGPSWAAQRDEDYAAWNTAHCAEVLRILLRPPPMYGESLKVDMDNMDLRWMSTGIFPRDFTTLLTWRASEVKEGVVPVINSPRSALVMLRSGIVASDLAIRKVGDDAPLLPKDPEARRVVKTIRMKHYIKSVESILERLRLEYSFLCSNVNLNELVSAFRSNRRPPVVEVQPTVIREALEKQRRLFEMASRKLDTEAAYAKKVQERDLLIEQRAQRLEEHMKEKMRRKREEELLMHQNAAARLKIQQQRCAAAEAEYQKQLHERLKRAEERSAHQQAARELLLEQRRIQRKKLAEERQARMEHAMQQQEIQNSLIKQKYEEREAKLEELRKERERRRVEAHEKLVEKAAKSSQLRGEVQQRALLRELELRKVAVEQQEEVEKRLQNLTKLREEEVVQRAKK